MYVNAKMVPVETIPGMGEEGIMEKGGGNEFKYAIFDTYQKYVSFCTCHKEISTYLKLVINIV
jgi:hypothetical protein